MTGLGEATISPYYFEGKQRMAKQTTSKRVDTAPVAESKTSLSAALITGAINPQVESGELDASLGEESIGEVSGPVVIADRFEGCELAAFIVPRMEHILAIGLDKASTVSQYQTAGNQFTAVINVLAAASPANFTDTVTRMLDVFRDDSRWTLPCMNRVTGNTTGSAVFYHGLLRIAKDPTAVINYRSMCAVFEGSHQERIADMLAAMFIDE